MAVIRFGVSLEQDLLEALDAFAQNNSYANRSQAVRALIEKNIVERKWQCNQRVAGAIVLVYDSKKYEIANHLLHIQQENAGLILSTQRFFEKNNLCIEIVAVDGTAQKLTKLSDELISLKGIVHGKLIMSRV
ncbi:nickel-responsive transcriptional regulator NikR [Bacteroidia bacterium]|nr:nickel-responsive transcriptional regulator NikR [Bacteroidia bacterium]GHT84586.1 nickel-responsive transcriptional regulator NikR [Bacteroidia bacterium]